MLARVNVPNNAEIADVVLTHRPEI